MIIWLKIGDLLHLFSAQISVRHSPKTNRPAQMGNDCYVEGKACCHTYWLHLTRGDTDGIMVMSSEPQLTSWSRRDGKSNRPTLDWPHPSSSSGRERSDPPPKGARGLYCRWHNHGWWGCTWKENYSYPSLIHTSLKPDVVIWQSSGKMYPKRQQKVKSSSYKELLLFYYFKMVIDTNP